MICPICGREIADGVRFCPSCGGDTSRFNNSGSNNGRSAPGAAQGFGAAMNGAPTGGTVITDPFKATLARIASSSIYLAFLIGLTVLVAGNALNLISLSSTTRGFYLHFDLTSVLALIFGILTLIPLYKLRGFTKGKNDGQNVLKNAAALTKYKKVITWILLVALIIAIISLFALISVTNSPSVKEYLSKIDLTEGSTFRESFTDVLSEDAIDSVYENSMFYNVDDAWGSALEALHSAAERTGYDLRIIDISAFIVNIEIAILVAVIFVTAFVILWIVYYSKLNKFIKNAQSSWNYGTLFTAKIGYIRVFSIILGVVSCLSIINSIYMNPLSLVVNGATAFTYIALFVLLGKFRTDLQYSYAYAAQQAASGVNAQAGYQQFYGGAPYANPAQGYPPAFQYNPVEPNMSGSTTPADQFSSYEANAQQADPSSTEGSGESISSDDNSGSDGE